MMFLTIEATSANKQAEASMAWSRNRGYRVLAMLGLKSSASGIAPGTGQAWQLLCNKEQPDSDQVLLQGSRGRGSWANQCESR